MKQSLGFSGIYKFNMPSIVPFKVPKGWWQASKPYTADIIGDAKGQNLFISDVSSHISIISDHTKKRCISST